MSRLGRPMSKRWQAVIGIVAAAGLTAFGQQLASGKVPIPTELTWLIPILVAMLNALTPRIGEPE